MEIIDRNRGTGKTTMLIGASSLTNYPILVSSKKEADRIKIMAEGMGYEIPDPITPFDITQRGAYGKYENIYIDELDKVLSALTGSNIKAAALTSDKYKYI